MYKMVGTGMGNIQMLIKRLLKWEHFCKCTRPLKIPAAQICTNKFGGIEIDQNRQPHNLHCVIHKLDVWHFGANWRVGMIR